MKKRVLSMLLLVALLVTGIPVMAISASNAEAETPAYTQEDYAELYVKQENLTHLYMAFDKEAAASYVSGKWTDLKDTAKTGTYDATFTKTWTAEEKGGISFSAPTNLSAGNAPSTSTLRRSRTRTALG